MIDIEHETIITLAEAARHPALRNHRSGKSAHLAQMYRHVQTGAKSVTGDRVRLEVIRCPAGLRTSREAIARFIAALSDADRPAPLPRTKSRQTAIDRAEQELVGAGFEVGESGI